MATTQEVAGFIQRRITFGRIQPGTNYWMGAFYSPPMAYFGGPLPTATDVARDLAQDAEFKALQLGGLLNTPEGAFLEEAVSMVVPRAIAPEFQILVDALKLAAQWQQAENRGNAVLAVGSTILASVFLNELLKALSKGAGGSAAG